MMNINKLFVENIWTTYYRRVSPSLFTIKENKERWYKIKVNSRYWCADPFVIQENGVNYFFCELMDRKISRGLIGYGVLNNEGDSEVKVLLDLGCHTSYPNVFKYKESYYMIPETTQRLTIELYKAVLFPSKWEKVKVLAEGINAADTTVFEKDGELFVFIYEPRKNCYNLSLGKLDLENYKITDLFLCKSFDSEIGRPGGNVINENGKLYRVAQYGVDYYGQKLVFREFNFDIERKSYQEKESLVIIPQDYRLSDSLSIKGTHTYNRSDNYEIVDVRSYKSFLSRPLSLLFKKIELFGYKFNH